VSLLERAGLALAHRLEPERAHALSLTALRLGFAPGGAGGIVSSARLATRLAGLTLANPIGLAAGFDKNAVALGALARAGFGFLEVGAATPLAQPGNPRPRLFRLPEDRAVINRFGFNNDGMNAISRRLAARRELPLPVGLNLGANKESRDPAADFATVLARCGAVIDFATVNVSSPNTAGLRALQDKAALTALLARVVEARAGLERPVPVFLKIAPDLDHAGLAAIAEVALASGIDGIVATNTTLARDGLQSVHRDEGGGLSGAPLFAMSTRVLARLAVLTGGKLPLIGVGGVATGEQAYAKIRAGASAVQLYTSMVYGGLSLVARIARELDAALARDGFDHVADAVGTGCREWL